MIAAPQGAQNSAYTPAPRHLSASWTPAQRRNPAVPAIHRNAGPSEPQTPLRSETLSGHRAPMMLRHSSIIAVGALAALHLGCRSERSELVLSGRVEVDQVNVGSKVGGRVASVLAEEGDRVSAGAVLLELEKAEELATLAQAIAEVQRAQANLDLLLAGTRAEDLRRAEAVVAAQRSQLDLRRKGFRDEEVRQAEAEVASTRSALDFAKRELDRAESLAASGTMEQMQLDARRNDHETAKALLEVAEQRLAMMRVGSRPEEIAMAEAQLAQAEADLDRLRNGARPEEIAATRAALAAAQANVQRIDAQIAEMTISAPADALVDLFDLEPGDLVRASQTVAILNLESTPWVRCYVPEDRLGEVRSGQRVTVAVDTWPGREFPGIVRRLSSEAEFTPRNVQTVAKRSQLVFEAKIDIAEGGEDLRSGMYADVRLAETP